MPKVLVVDDEPLIAMMIADWLVEQGIEVAGPAYSVSQALALIEVESVDAAILDISLGDENCYAVAEVLSSQAIPFVFATGHGADATNPRYAGVPTVAKPFDFDTVRAAVLKLLGGSHLAPP